jgi:hypothetical protein
MSEDRGELTQLLREIRDCQDQALELQRQQFELYRQQWERAERINAKAEALQQRGLGMMGFAKVLLVIVGAALVVLLGLALWRLL